MPPAAAAPRLIVRVRYPPGHHRHQPVDGREWQAHGDGVALAPDLAELLAWTLRRQGAAVELVAAQRQLALF